MHNESNISGPAIRRYVRPYGPVPAPEWYLGLDLGQRKDHSALAIFHQQWTPIGRCAQTYEYLFQSELTVRSLERYPLRTSYEKIPEIVATRANQIGERHRAAQPHTQASMQLIVDAGGPGGPMVDRLRRVVPDNIAIKPVLITGGTGENQLTGGFAGIPRRALITKLIQLLTSGCLTCPSNLTNVTSWINELLALSGTRAKDTKGGEHDDLTMAAALAAWAAVTPGGDPAPQKTIGFVDKPLF